MGTAYGKVYRDKRERMNDEVIVSKREEENQRSKFKMSEKV